MLLAAIFGGAFGRRGRGRHGKQSSSEEDNSTSTTTSEPEEVLKPKHSRYRNKY